MEHCQKILREKVRPNLHGSLSFADRAEISISLLGEAALRDCALLAIFGAIDEQCNWWKSSQASEEPPARKRPAKRRKIEATSIPEDDLGCRVLFTLSSIPNLGYVSRSQMFYLAILEQSSNFEGAPKDLLLKEISKWGKRK